MHAQNFFVYQSADWQAIKDIREDLPEFDRVSAFALVVETVYSVDLSTLVIASKEKEVFRVLYLIAEKKSDSLD